MKTMTQRMNENLLKRIETEKELLSSKDVFDLINNIEPVNPIFYYQRLICEKFPDSETEPLDFRRLSPRRR